MLKRTGNKIVKKSIKNVSQANSTKTPPNNRAPIIFSLLFFLGQLSIKPKSRYRWQTNVAKINFCSYETQTLVQDLFQYKILKSFPVLDFLHLFVLSPNVLKTNQIQKNLQILCINSTLFPAPSVAHNLLVSKIDLVLFLRY